MVVASDFDSFIAGFAYGTTTVIVGQPFDTIKTRMQALGTHASMMNTTTSIFKTEGFAGLYRGECFRVVLLMLEVVRRIVMLVGCSNYENNIQERNKEEDLSLFQSFVIYE